MSRRLRWVAPGLVLWGALLATVLSARPACANPPAEPNAAQKDSAATDIDGAWQGALRISGIELRLVLKIKRDEKGSYQATLDSPDQNANDIPVAGLSRDGNKIEADVKRIAGTYTASLSDDGQLMKGTWKQAGQEFALDLKRLDKLPDYSRPQDPKKPYPYRAEEVAYQNEAAQVTFAGTLTLPQSETPVPAVLLISGSGPQDRDEALLGHRPFLVLADYLTRHGIAVLRVDDRGVGGSSGNTMSATTDDFAGDALAGVAYLRTRGEIDPAKIGLIGHSEGGLVAPLAASRSDQVAFIVLMAGTGVTGEEILYRQGALIGRAGGADDETVAKATADQKRILEIVKQEPDPKTAAARVREVMSESPEAAKLGEAQLTAAAQMVVSPWFRFFLTYDPAATLAKVRCPVLAINGEKDLQVDPQQNMPTIEAALKKAENADCTFRVFPGLNHLFQHCETGSPSEYGKIEETISPEVLDVIATWITEHTQ